MTCDDCEAVLIDRGAGEKLEEAALRVHLSACARCRAFDEAVQEALSLAELPPLSEAEEKKLEGLAGSTLAVWRAAERRPHPVRRWVALATAACVGGLVTAAVLSQRSPRVGRSLAPEVRTSLGTEELSWELAELPLLEESSPMEVELALYEVPWTLSDDSLLEGDVK
ncbi:MAG: hypothetical protein ACOZIN_19795 [Myxococcota bacterium]